MRLDLISSIANYFHVSERVSLIYFLNDISLKKQLGL